MTRVPFFPLPAMLLVFTSSCGFDHSKSESVNAGDNPGTAARWSEISGDVVCPLRDSSACGVQGIFTISSTGDYSLRLQGQRQGQDQAQVLGSVSGSELSQLLAQYNDFVANDLPSSIICVHPFVPEITPPFAPPLRAIRVQLAPNEAGHVAYELQAEGSTCYRDSLGRSLQKALDLENLFYQIVTRHEGPAPASRPNVSPPST